MGALIDRTGSAKAGLFLLAGVLLVTAVGTYLYGRRTGAGKVPPTSRDDLLAKETAAFDLPSMSWTTTAIPTWPSTAPDHRRLTPPQPARPATARAVAWERSCRQTGGPTPRSGVGSQVGAVRCTAR